MLAAPKRKIHKYNKMLTTAEPLSASNVGRKLLKKMGWSEGCGLGLNEDGMKCSVPVFYKSDTKGVGYGKSNAVSVWEGHQRTYEHILKSLSNSDNGGYVPSAVDRVSGFKYKTLKAKDISRKTQCELKCVWNADSFKNENKECDSSTSLNNIVTSKKSSFDYFKAKMNNSNISEQSEDTHVNSNQPDKCLRTSDVDTEKTGKRWNQLQSHTTAFSSQIKSGTAKNETLKKKTRNNMIKFGERDATKWFPGSNILSIPGYAGCYSTDNIDYEIKLALERRQRKRTENMRKPSKKYICREGKIKRI
ncbi:hypothetical protein GJ496_008443 [Pomphorhynchus laevis]|nr:hypothetical protein GJ496_008443 [Pomphorhynchus laevis]